MITDHTRQQYRNDHVYHALVDWMAAFLTERRFTVWELEQASALAYELAELRRLADAT